MRKTIIAAAFVAAASAAVPAFAMAEGTHYVRNETGETQNCTIRHAGSNYAAPIILRANGEWSGTSRTERTSTLICRGAARDMTFRLQSGQRYALRKTGAGTLTLSSAS